MSWVMPNGHGSLFCGRCLWPMILTGVTCDGTCSGWCRRWNVMMCRGFSSCSAHSTNVIFSMPAASSNWPSACTSPPLEDVLAVPDCCLAQALSPTYVATPTAIRLSYVHSRRRHKLTGGYVAYLEFEKRGSRGLPAPSKIKCHSLLTYVHWTWQRWLWIWPSPSVAHGSSSPPPSPPSPLSVTTSVFHSELKTWLFGKSFPP